MARVLVYCAASLDGYIAGPDDDIEWLEAPRPPWAPMAEGTWADAPADAVSYEDFTAGIGAMLMGRRTFNVVSAMEGPWPYGGLPILVATTRPLDGAPSTVATASAPITEMVESAKALAGDKDVYLDGGTLIGQALDAGLVDELIVTQHPTVLGAGSPLFAGVTTRRHITVVSVTKYGDGMVQLRLRPAYGDE